MQLGLVELAVRRCALSKWSGDHDRCRWCDALTPAGEWCSMDCHDEYEANHDWARARSTRLIQDGECCSECGTGPADVTVGRWLIRALVPMGPVEAARLWRSTDWLGYELSCSVDVAHDVPSPEGYRSGCHNHLDGLVTICRRCQDRNRATIDLRRAG